MDSRAFLDAARAVLRDCELNGQERITNDVLFAAVEAKLGVGRLPRRTWARRLSSLGLKPARWNSGKVRGWQLPDVTEPDVTEPDVTEPDVTELDVTELDVTELEPPAGRPKCRVRLPNPGVAGYMTKEALLEAIKQNPHLRPCPKRKWWWQEWKYCERCDWKLPAAPEVG